MQVSMFASQANTLDTNEDDAIEKLLENHREKDCLLDFAELPPYTWTIVLTPLLFLYLIVVAQAAEITVKCRYIAEKFTNQENTALFIYFEFEVCAFFGMMIGLWAWITVKYILNTIYLDG